MSTAGWPQAFESRAAPKFAPKIPECIQASNRCAIPELLGIFVHRRVRSGHCYVIIKGIIVTVYYHNMSCLVLSRITWLGAPAGADASGVR